MRTRDLQRVTCKCALYTPDGKKVLLVEYNKGRYGLPGGHIDSGESPDHAMNRELFEELGIQVSSLQHKDFWLHQNGKIILGFTGILDERTPLTLQVEEVDGVRWANIDDVATAAVRVPSYEKFIVAFAPR